jgi:hypothetical protein
MKFWRGSRRRNYFGIFAVQFQFNDFGCSMAGWNASRRSRKLNPKET